MRAANIEQTKLLATAINNVAVAFIVIGFVTPITAASFNLGGVGPLRSESTVLTLVWLFTGIGIHLIARRILRGITP
ncbi:hypothetical protein MKK64_11390 [Methylobacterium sp. E-025]|uniref:hypothetical protein n=1 Tax=unclassified Methylobacterium TaxID=2615210 RepID=UPI0011C8AE7A|nr:MULTISPECIES: hypothetical protein [unclassified Methylobacterium]MCJ2009627.1 hypothetical protein [Methylobacterium sp. J-092]MCJ2075080.1 hypothetical protein [Methylobacterium sp. E-016]MCJ2111798.1 hypothetical protein [Methylobacterium sp. E-025]TXN69797.1 hypothetical protein FV230_11315 [Methylobacterium sp. WL6]